SIFGESKAGRAPDGVATPGGPIPTLADHRHFRGTGAEARKANRLTRIISAGQRAPIPKTENKCSPSVISTQGAQLNVGLATLSRISCQIRQKRNLPTLERQVEMPLLFSRVQKVRHISKS